jgi:hypothetical protein
MNTDPKHIIFEAQRIDFEELYGGINMSITLKILCFIYAVNLGEPSNFNTHIYLIRKVNTGTPYSFMIEVCRD